MFERILKKMKKIAILLCFLVSASWVCGQQNSAAQDKVRVIVIGAHPDDCELGAGGLAAHYVSAGHAVKFVSLTNGDKGHQDSGGGPLAVRRHKEAMEAGRRLGVSYEILDVHDGELFPTLENRLQVIRMIREWDADIVLSHRPNDYHPDHRNAAILVQDAAYMVIVPNMLSSVPPLKKNPVFLYMRDRFQRPNPHRPDIAIDIAPVFQKKLDALDAHVSQFYEWLPWTAGRLAEVPTSGTSRKKWLEDWVTPRYAVTEEIRISLGKWYGAQKASAVKMAETFEITEYGRQPNEAEVRRLFPMILK
jgi:LmbE family N-acetylglucosaminyl deacetylase